MQERGRDLRSIIEHMSQVEGRAHIQWRIHALDTILAITGALLVTAIISTFHLYPAIPNISIAHLLLILPLATGRSFYAAILASVTAFLSFDFFLTRPLYTFTIAQPSDWIALFFFLIVALFASQLANTTRHSEQLT
jgi:two-component system, OmpR family, sensor histidine kinase KdpD